MKSAVTTDARLASITATGGIRSITVNWETISEVDNLGFNLYRSTTSDGRIMTKLNDQLIPTLLPPGSLGGTTYTYVDSAAMKPRTTYYYWLQSVDLSGGTALFGPVSAQAR